MSKKEIRMDYRTKLTIASGLLAALSLTAILGFAFSQQSVAQRQAQEPLLVGFQASAVASIQLSNGVSLKKDKTWVLTYQGKPFPASNDRVETYLTTLATLQRDRLVASADQGGDYGLDQGYPSIKLLNSDGKLLVELEVGKAAESGNKVYVRLAGQKPIYETDLGFSRTLSLDFNTWADLSLFPGKKAENLIRIAFDSRIETSEKTVFAPFDLVKNTKDGKEVWEDRLTKTTTESFSSWANSVAGFRFGAFVSPDESAPTGAPLGTVTLSWSDGSVTSVKIGSPDKQNRYRCTDGTLDFWVNDWSLGQILHRASQ